LDLSADGFKNAFAKVRKNSNLLRVHMLVERQSETLAAMHIRPKQPKSVEINIDTSGLRSKTRGKMCCLPRKLPDLDVAVLG
jgi:hypothetical protein